MNSTNGMNSSTGTESIESINEIDADGMDEATSSVETLIQLDLMGEFARVPQLCLSLIRAQGQVEKAQATDVMNVRGESGNVRRTYAGLGSLIAVAKPALAENNLAIFPKIDIPNSQIEFWLIWSDGKQSQSLKVATTKMPNTADMRILSGHASNGMRLVFKTLLCIADSDEDAEASPTEIEYMPDKSLERWVNKATEFAGDLLKVNTWLKSKGIESPNRIPRADAARLLKELEGHFAN